MSALLQVTWFAALVAAGDPKEAAKRPEVGSAAPAFSAASTTGKPFTLAEWKGKRTVVLAFFPKAFTGG